MSKPETGERDGATRLHQRIRIYPHLRRAAVGMEEAHACWVENQYVLPQVSSLMTHSHLPHLTKCCQANEFNVQFLCRLGKLPVLNAKHVKFTFFRFF